MNVDFSVFANDSRLTSLPGLSLAALHRALERAIPSGALERPVRRYSIANLRYVPGQKLVIGMTAPDSLQSLGVRVFPCGQLAGRLAKARRGGASGVYRLDEASALVWVFPAERKLALDVLTDRVELDALVRNGRGLALEDIELVHFVPEHAYTARLECLSGDGGRVHDYLKIHYDGSGARTAQVMAVLERQCAGSPIRLAAPHCYLPRHRLLLQASLDVEHGSAPTDLDAARALAHFHRLRLPRALHATSSSTLERTAQVRARALLSSVLPAMRERHERALGRLSALRDRGVPSAEVVLHGDAHPGNLCRTRDGCVGLIDLDAVRIGAPEQDLAGYFASRLWQGVHRDTGRESMLSGFPEFVDAYNGAGGSPVPLRRGWVRLAATLLHDRVARAIARVKIGGAGDMGRLLELGECVVECAEHAR